MTTLGIFAKEPVPGRVKTRLAAQVGPHDAARLAEAFQCDILTATRGLADRRVLAFDSEPSLESDWLHRWETEVDAVWPQPEAPLGERLRAFFERWCDAENPCVVIGSDSPTLPVEFIRDAFVGLEKSDCVIGPAWDGGYYLIGLRTPLPELFEKINWSTPRVLAQTIARLNRCQRSLTLLPAWYDVDTPSDLRFLDAHLHTMKLISRMAGIPEQTMRMLTEISCKSPGGVPSRSAGG